MSKTYEQIVAELDSKIPRDVISQRDAGNGRSLSYLEGHYVIDRLNKVLGVGKWAYGAELTKVFEGEANGKFATSYIAKVRMVVTIGASEKEVTTEFIDVGYGDGFDKANPGKAHELAVKEAVTDGIKRCAKNLGMSMGLALYDKTQENVEDAKPEATQVQSTRTVRSIGIRKSTTPNFETRQTETTNNTSAASNNKTANSRVYADIATASRVAIAKKKATQESLTGLISKYGVKSKEELNETQATELLTTIRGML